MRKVPTGPQRWMLIKISNGYDLARDQSSKTQVTCRALRHQGYLDESNVLTEQGQSYAKSLKADFRSTL